MRKLLLFLAVAIIAASCTASGGGFEYATGSGQDGEKIRKKESPTRYIYGDKFKKIASTPCGNVYEIEIDGRKYLLYNESAIIPKDGCSCCAGK